MSPKGNKHSAARILSIPSEFMPLIEKERERRRCFTYHETIGQILREYFNSNGKPKPKPKPISQANPAQLLKGKKPND